MNIKNLGNSSYIGTHFICQNLPDLPLKNKERKNSTSFSSKNQKKVSSLTMADVCYETPQKKGQQALHLYSIANFVAS